MSLRREVIGLYRQVFRVARNWQALNPNNTAAEKEYIQNEARSLFRQNKQVTDSHTIKEHLREGRSRLEIGLHYQIPYPRPVHLPQNAVAQSASRKLKSFDRLVDASKPVYIKSY